MEDGALEPSGKSAVDVEGKQPTRGEHGPDGASYGEASASLDFN